MLLRDDFKSFSQGQYLYSAFSYCRKHTRSDTFGGHPGFCKKLCGCCRIGMAQICGGSNQIDTVDNHGEYGNVTKPGRVFSLPGLDFVCLNIARANKISITSWFQ